jgi:hypothetical protein
MCVGDIASQQIQAYFTTSTVGDGKFRGTVAEYINHFTGQYDVYKCIMGTTLPNSQKLGHLFHQFPSTWEWTSLWMMME